MNHTSQDKQGIIARDDPDLNDAVEIAWQNAPTKTTTKKMKWISNNYTLEPRQVSLPLSKLGIDGGSWQFDVTH